MLHCAKLIALDNLACVDCIFGCLDVYEFFTLQVLFQDSFIQLFEVAYDFHRQNVCLFCIRSVARPVLRGKETSVQRTQDPTGRFTLTLPSQKMIPFSIQSCLDSSPPCGTTAAHW